MPNPYPERCVAKLVAGVSFDAEFQLARKFDSGLQTEKIQVVLLLNGQPSSTF
jgi:hypothetical protein